MPRRLPKPSATVSKIGEVVVGADGASAEPEMASRSSARVSVRSMRMRCSGARRTPRETTRKRRRTLHGLPCARGTVPRASGGVAGGLLEEPVQRAGQAPYRALAVHPGDHLALLVD